MPDRDQNTITIWPGEEGWELIEDLEELAEERNTSRNQLILEAISMFLGSEDAVRGNEVWESSSELSRRMIIRTALEDYAEEW